MLQFNNSSNNTTTDGLIMQEEMSVEAENQHKNNMKPPPKPPKPNNMRKISNTSLILHEADLNEHSANNSSFQSSNQHSTKELHQTKSNTSLNNIQFKNLGSKTSSDSILNRVSLSYR